MPDTRPQVRDNSLDFVRGIAILLVLSAHVPFETVPRTLPYYLAYPGKTVGGYGVDLFFVLSGFLIGGLLMREYAHTGTIDGVRFLKRRAYKLWPNYFVYIVLAGMVLNPKRIREIWPNFLHLQNYLGTPLAQTWSLAVEEHFYLILVVILSIMAAKKAISYRSVVWVCVSLMAVAILSRVFGPYFGQSFWITFHGTHTRIDTLAVGILLAAMYRLKPDTFQAIARQKALLWIFAIGALVFDFLVADDGRLKTTVGYDILALGSAATVILCFSAEPGKGLLGVARQQKWYGWVALIGTYSYGIYLWHRTGVSTFMAIDHRLHFGYEKEFFLGTAFYLITGVTIGILATRFIEFPFLVMRDRKVPGAEISPLIGAPTGEQAQELQLKGEAVPEPASP